MLEHATSPIFPKTVSRKFRVKLSHTNDMLRALGLNAPTDDENVMVHSYDWITGVETWSRDLDERPIMDAAGWDVDSMPVDVFMEAPAVVRFKYLNGMERDYGRRDHWTFVHCARSSLRMKKLRRRLLRRTRDLLTSIRGLASPSGIQAPAEGGYLKHKR